MAQGGVSFWAGLTVIGMTVAVLDAQIPAASSTDGVDGIAGAKRDLEAVKAAAVPGVSGASRTLPVFDLPTLPGPIVDAPLRPAPDTTRRQEARPRSGDWVLADPNNRNRARSGADAMGDDNRLMSRDRSLVGPEQFSAKSSLAGDRDPETPVGPIPRDFSTLKPVNPLAPYLAGWISTQDYRLLTAVRDPDRTPTAATGESPESRVAPLTDGGLIGISGESRRGVGQVAGARTEVAPPANNPYLEAFATPAPPPRVPSPAIANTPPAWANVALPQMTPKTEVERNSAPTRVPEFVRSTSDDKYFKPLKRF